LIYLTLMRRASHAAGVAAVQAGPAE
jgi:hypothetical protein